MKEILIVDKNSHLLFNWFGWEEMVVDNKLRVSSNWEKLAIVIDAEISEWKLKTDGINYDI